MESLFEVKATATVEADTELDAIEVFRARAREDKREGMDTACRKLEHDSPVFTEVHFLAMSEGQWAKGHSLGDAMLQLAKGGFPRRSFAVYLIHPRTTVDGLGNFNYPTGHRPRLVWSKTRLK